MKALLLSLLVLGACGKKAQVNPKKPIDVSAPQMLLLTQNENLRHAVEANDARSVESLLRAGSDPELLFNDGSSLLNFSLTHNFTAIVEVLLQNGASPNSADKNGDTPLFVALDLANPTFVKTLVRSGAHINARDPYERTPLMLAILVGDTELSQWLLDRGAQIPLRDSRGRDAIQYAVEMGLPEFANALRVRLKLHNGEATSELLADLIKNADLEGINLLLKEKSSLLQAPVSPSPMRLAIEHTHELRSRTMAAMLLNFGASVERNGNDGLSPMALAAQRGRMDLIKLFLAHGGDVEALDDKGVSVMGHAIKGLQEDVVQGLLALEVKQDYKFLDRSIRACDLARDTRERVTSPEEQQRIERIMQHLRCGIRRLFFW